MKRLAQTTSQPAQKALKVENHDSRWQRIGSLLLFKSSIEGSKQGERKIASFDLDCTLIKTKSGTVFARDEHDWQFLNNQVPATLQSFKEQQYDIIIFTNQNGLKNQEKIDEFKRKISAISKALDVNFTLLAALEKVSLKLT